MVHASLLQRGHISEQSQWYIAHGVVVSGNKSYAGHTQYRSPSNTRPRHPTKMQRLART